MTPRGEDGERTEPRPSSDAPARAPGVPIRYVRQDPPFTQPNMTEPRDMQLEALRERVSRSEYEVDSRAVAAAILARLGGDHQPPDLTG